MIQSRHEKCIWYVFPGSKYESKSMEGGWYFTDETENFGGGPYSTEKEAIEELNKYAAWLNGEVTNGNI
jgi:hypothetical protein